MLAASNMSRITLTKSSFSFGVSSHLVRGSLSFTRSSASIFSLFGFVCIRQGNFPNAVDTSAEFLILFLNRTAMVLCVQCNSQRPALHQVRSSAYQAFQSTNGDA